MTLNDLLNRDKIDPQTVLVFRHRPSAPELNKALPWLAAEKPDVFNAYQQTQGERVERAMLGAKFVASFLGREAGKALFVGLYAIGASRSISRAEFWQIPAYIELKALGLKGLDAVSARSCVLWFDLAVQDFYKEWKGKLVINWPPPERAWWRRAHRNEIDILAVHEESALDAHMPAWEDLGFTWDELRLLPTRWKAKLSEWRAIYYIYDVSDGKAYVGSAYGNTNLLGRWLGYAAKGHGGNALLRQRQPQNFRFSILQRVSPDMEAADVIRLEASWKDRLHSRVPLGLNDN